MAFVVEDGTGKIDSNSYGSVADSDIYFNDRGNAEWAALSTQQKQQNLVKATDYIDLVYGSRFIGYKATDEQALQWPRIDAEGYASNEIPIDLEKATFEYALRSSVNVLIPDGFSGAAIKKEKVGPIETEYDTSRGSTLTAIIPYPGADLYLYNLVAYIDYGNRVIR